MKNLFLVLSFLCLGVAPALAQPGRSMLKFRLSDRAPLSVAVDGRYYDRQGSSLTIGDLPPGWHAIKVYRMAGFGDRYGHRAELVYTGRVRIAPETFNAVTVDVYEGSMSLRTRPMERDGERYSYRDREQPAGRSDDRREDRIDIPDNRQEQTQEAPPVTEPQEPAYDNSPRGNVVTIGRQDLDNLQEKVRRQIADSDKEKLMQEELTERSFSTEQVRGMLRWLTFESTRLEFAKWAYGNVTDPGNYRGLESEFTFNTNKEEFRDFLQGK